MKKNICIFVLVLILLPGLILARSIGSEIYPTEDELYEAFLIGEIDFQTYINLLEIYNAGIDSTELYLFDEIPNIDYFWGDDSHIDSDLKKEQTKPYVLKEEKRVTQKISSSIVLKRYQRINKSARDQNRVYIKSQLSKDWSFKLNGVDEYNGHQEFSFRSLNYRNSRGSIRKLKIGNFTARFGLGLTIGYRGRLLRKDHLSPDETIFFPDYGGFNGLYAEIGPKKSRVKWLFHYDKNDSILVKTSALNITKKLGAYRVEGTLFGTIINNRLTDNEFRQYQVGLLMAWSGYDFDIAIEGTLPTNNLQNSNNKNQAVVAEITYKINDFALKFSAWHYGQNFVNCFGGARSGDLYRTVNIGFIDLDYRDRRQNQRGFILRTSTFLTKQTDAKMSFSIYGSSRYERFIEIQTSLGKIIAEKTRLRLYYELFRKERFGEVSNNNAVKLEYNYKLPKFSLRSFIGFNFNNEDQKYFSMLLRSKFKSTVFKDFEIWINFSRINIETGNIDYFYAYIREMVELSKTISLAVKYRFRYSRRFTESKESMESTIYLETKVVW